MGQAIKRGILQSFSAGTYTANVLILEAGSTALNGVPVATHLDNTSAQVGALCAVLFFDVNNLADAVVIACYPNGTQGVPSPAPGRVTFSSPTLLLNATSISSGATATYNTNVPAGALGVLVRAYFTSATVGAYVQIGPHGGNLNDYLGLGNMPVANGFLNGSGMVPVDASGNIDVKATGGNCTVTVYIYGYVS